MVGKKKGVPEWLNSPLWSSNPPNDRIFSSYDTGTLSPDPPPSPPPPPPKEPSPSRPGLDGAHRSEIRAPARESSQSWSWPEDESLEAQLLVDFQITLSKRIINLGELRRLACQGIPQSLRPTVWKLLLGYLPLDQTMWAHELGKKHNQYKTFKDEFLLYPSEITSRMEASEGSKYEELNCLQRLGLLSRSEIKNGEHPLSLAKTSVWNQYFQEKEILEQIERDVNRTHPEIEFFSGGSSFARANQEALRHILVIFAKLNPGIKYVQGMNEVLALVFYVFRNDPDETDAACAEADTFFCFSELLSVFRENFCKQLDNTVVGIRSTIAKLSQLLKRHDEELWRHLEVTTKVNPQFYAFRWITLLLTREFNFTDCLRIWDTLLSDPEGPHETLLRICCAMLIRVRRRLLAGDFISNLKLLQNFPTTNINHILHVANKLRGPTVD
ncbi:hypothetical protein Cni_G12914 [Canna indica]|uniref:Rab-GAP TBC domain-containing protein n=1 Tax=Canna indica TaxID=4628 RepID=A0AAQ3KBL9_9LILI|nr:hypothetical protein Cni_G12914 [Canna indica]